MTREELALMRHRPYVVRIVPRERWRSWMVAPIYQILYEDIVVHERVCTNRSDLLGLERFCDSLNAAYSTGVADTLAKITA